VCIDNNLNTYTNAKTKHEKSMVVTVAVDAVTESSTQERGGFVRKDLVSGRWYEVGDKIAREKVGHALRDAIKLNQKLENKEVTNAAKPDRSKPEQSRPVKRRRTEVRCKQNIKQSKSVPVPSADEPPSVACSESEWEKSLSASAEQFAVAVGESQPFGEESDDESRSGDSVLNEMALETSSASGSEDEEKAYQSSLAELQIAEEDSFSFAGSSKDVEAAAAKKSASQSISSGDSKPGGPFDDFMKRFLGAVPLGRNPVAASRKFEWKPPGDSSTEAAFDTFMKTLNPNPVPTPSSKGLPAFSAQPMVRSNVL
jgi:hypothetical protein